MIINKKKKRSAALGQGKLSRLTLSSCHSFFAKDCVNCAIRRVRTMSTYKSVELRVRGLVLLELSSGIIGKNVRN